MATKKSKEINNLGKDELNTKIREAKKALFDAKIQHATGQLENTSSVWQMRKDLARMKFRLENLNSTKEVKA